jgi:hypothetical protein
MFALGCIQARVCNKNICPTGITTMNKWRTHGLVVEDKYKRVAAYHEQTIRNFLSVLAACGMSDPALLEPGMLNRRVAANEIKTYRDLYPMLDAGELLDKQGPAFYRELWHAAEAQNF